MERCHDGGKQTGEGGFGEVEEDRQREKINNMLFADDTVLLAESEKDLQKLVNEFSNVCERRKLKVNVKKSKVMIFEKKKKLSN